LIILIIQSLPSNIAVITIGIIILSNWQLALLKRSHFPCSFFCTHFLHMACGTWQLKQPENDSNQRFLAINVFISCQPFRISLEPLWTQSSMECWLFMCPLMKHNGHRPLHSSNCCSNSHTSCPSCWFCLYTLLRCCSRSACCALYSYSSATVIKSLVNLGFELGTLLVGLCAVYNGSWLTNRLISGNSMLLGVLQFDCMSMLLLGNGSSLPCIILLDGISMALSNLYSYSANACCNASASAAASSSFQHTSHRSSPSSHRIRFVLPSISWSKWICRHRSPLMNRLTFSCLICALSMGLITLRTGRLNCPCNASCRPASTKMMALLRCPSLLPLPLSCL